jgi:putative membrane protein
MAPVEFRARRASVKTKLGLGLATLAGLFLLIALVAYNGFAGVAKEFLAAGWAGILAASLFHFVPLMFSALGWRSLLAREWTAPPILFVWVRLIREGVANLLPVVQIGGEVVGARILTFHGLRGGVAGASVVVDLTVEVGTQFLFTLIGLGFLVVGHRDSGAYYWLIAGLAIAVPLLLGFFAAQHWGLFKLLEHAVERMADKWEWFKEVSLSGLHDSIKKIYRNPRGVMGACVCHLLSWIVGSGEIWIALRFMGHGVNFREALILESLAQAVRSVGFAVPGALGVQEGGFLLVGGLLGISPDVSLALSLVKRVRDLLLGLPSLAGWHVLEGRRMWLRFRHRARHADKG